jgi:thiol-disulfide isomerase/thioredoxin
MSLVNSTIALPVKFNPSFMKYLMSLFLLLIAGSSFPNQKIKEISSDRNSFYNDTTYIKIHIEIEGQKSNVIQAYIPGEHFFLGLGSLKTEILGNNYFDFKIPISNSSFFGIGFNNEFFLPLAGRANDSIAIKVKRIQKANYPEYVFSFSGSNSEANTIYLNRFYPAGKNYDFLEDLPKMSKTYTDYYLSAKSYIDSITQVWDSLKINKIIPNEIYKLYVAETKGSLFGKAIRRLSKVNPLDSGWASYTKWLQVKNVMYFNSDASNSIHLKTHTGQILYQNFLLNILREDDNINDSLLKKSSIAYFYYYDTAYREEAWGKYLLHLNNFFGGLHGDIDKIDLQVFKNYYPNSSYLVQINNFQDSILKERKALQLPININTEEFQSMERIMNSINGRYFFIDVWATWCFPCVQEFRYYTHLSEFLKTKNIVGVFISIDNKKDKNKWEEFIKKQNLSGNHFLINDSVQNELLKVISEGKEDNTFSIPRYLLYDKTEKKYYIDLPRPSTGIVLESLIENILSSAKNSK